MKVLVSGCPGVIGSDLADKLLEQAYEVIGIHEKQHRSNTDVVGIIERAIGGRARVEYIEKQKGDLKDTWGDVSKAEAKLNWNLGVNINKGLQRLEE